MKLRSIGQVLWLSTIWLGCGTGSSQAARAPQAVQAQKSAPPSPPADASSGGADALSTGKELPNDAFIVQAESGQLELRSASAPATQVLAKSADLTVYDAALELLWYTDEGRLYVIDLRTNSLTSVVIASGIPDVSVLQIRQQARSVATTDTCQGPKLDLLWNDNPSVEAYDADASDTRIDGRSWLQEQLARPARAISKTRGFDGKPVRLPRRVLDCEEPSACATTTALGTRGVQLVLVLDKSGGDCWNRACFLRDPTTNLYASPPHAERWASAVKTKHGTCGLYFFDQAQTSYLVADKLCTESSGCVALGGRALGWLQPGETVGAIGDIGDEE